MKNIIKTFGLLAIFATISGAWAATSRVGMISKASPRLPSIAGHLVVGSPTNGVIRTTTGTTTSASYYDNTECIDKYTECIKDDEVCGSDMSECTTVVLFNGKMANCLSVLYQCQSSGVNALFGTSSISALSCTEDANGDITSCTYPQPGSVLHQLITGAAISNQFNTEQCVKSYTRCLQRDNVCGADFELCTDNKSFKKQALLCDSTLQRCQSEGKKQLFGEKGQPEKLVYETDSRIGTMVEEGKSLAAMNAVKTCQKVTDNCLISACTKNPLRCVEGIKLDTINQVDIIESGITTENKIVQGSDYTTSVSTKNSIQKWLKAQCLETIGGNQYCHMTYRETPNVSKKDLVDIDLQEDVFALAYEARKNPVNTEVQKMVTKFDTKAKDACYATIKSCAMRSCGGGLGSVCYKQSHPTATSETSSSKYTNEIHINSGQPYVDITAGCSAIVNADANCIYAASASDTGYSYTYYDENNSTFKTLFPQYTGLGTASGGSSTTDPIGAVGRLNSLLATSYNDAAIENMKKQCETIAKSCVKSMCGKDYINCYRNRTDIVISGPGAYATGDSKFDRSMNKMGGVLDYNIVMGLCMDNVKSSSVCEEHLKIATIGVSGTGDSWSVFDDNGNATSFYNSVREAWLGSNTTAVKQITKGDDNDVLIACRANNTLAIAYNAADAMFGTNLNCTGTMEPLNGKCDGVMDEDGCIYDTPVYMSQSEYVLENGAKTLFQTLLMDIEKEAQAKYNAKLNKEQNVCLNNNSGGIMGASDNGSTFMWVKLKGSKVPKDYQMKGLTTSQFTASNDLYGSFCRVKVTIQSDDKYIQDQLGKYATAYFAVGDVFTCGSWIPQTELQKISDSVANRKLCQEGYGKWNTETGECDVNAKSAKEKRSLALGTILPFLGAGAAATALTESGALSGILGLNKDDKSKFKTNRNSCTSLAKQAYTEANKTPSELQAKTAQLALERAIKQCGQIGTANCPTYTKTEITNKNYTDEMSTMSYIAQTVETACNDADKPEDKASDLSTGARIAIPLGTAALAGGAGLGITANVIKSKKENIKNEAAQQWMNEVGDHIQCYVGTNEMGTYGDPIAFEID